MKARAARRRRGWPPSSPRPRSRPWRWRCRPRRRTASGAAGTDHASRRLHRYAVDTWRSFVAMTDPATGLPADNIRATSSAGTPQRLHLARPTSAPTCGARSSPATSGSSARRRRTSGSRRRWRSLADARAPRARAGSSTTGTTRTPAPSSAPGRRTATRSSRSCPPSTTAGWPPRCCWSPARTPRWPRRPTRSARTWTSRSTTTPPRTPRAARSAAASGTRTRRTRRRSRATTPARARRLVHRPPLRRLQHRAPDRHLHRHRQGPDPAGALLRHLAHLPPTPATGAGRRPSRSGVTAPTWGQTSSRARYPTAAWTSSRPGAAACSRR